MDSSSICEYGLVWVADRGIAFAGDAWPGRASDSDVTDVGGKAAAVLLEAVTPLSSEGKLGDQSGLIGVTTPVPSEGDNEASVMLGATGCSQ